ncbi:FkbM family methyltransferase [Altererythrobacter sp. HHU K3-1]|uniref:FkbM family methyltransferase n=1 Tax=Qipengyuania atrilutea TaxID=2744473 RepID=A0A850H2T0_9SPHN|nr:FkbM family methyltransferase [Actirhodobacter atriluteus]
MARRVRRLAARAGIGIVRQRELESLRADRGAGHNLAFLKALPEQAPRLLPLLDASTAQLRQDLFALAITGFKRGGYFVEFGATDGKTLSNTHLLEKKFDWSGILAEPARCWHALLEENRDCIVDRRCVWHTSGERLPFSETGEAELSTIGAFTGSDHHAAARRGAASYDVQTVSLTDLLAQHEAPAEIDYLSIDTEGSEFAILEAFDFARYSIRVITCEHNYTDNRERIRALLEAQGYERRLEHVSQFDDWYVRAA